MLRRVSVIVVALLTAGLLAACGSGTGADPGGSEPAITLYSGQHVQTTDTLVSGFEKATGIKVNVRSDDEDVLAEQIVAEGKHSPADVIFTENSPALEFLQDKGLLAKVDASTLDHTPRKYDSPQGDWAGISGRVSVLTYNPKLIAANQLPKTVLAMASPRYKGKLAVAPGETDFQPIVTAVERAYGKSKAISWLRGVKRNAGKHVYPDNETIASDVSRGTVAFGVVNQYYWYRMGAEIGQSKVHSKIAYFEPHNPGYVIDVSGAAVLKSSKHAAEAQKFLAYLVSKPAQDIIASPSKSISYEYPIDSGVKTQAPETPFSRLQPYPITIGELGEGQAAVTLLKQVGLL